MKPYAILFFILLFSGYMQAQNTCTSRKFKNSKIRYQIVIQTQEINFEDSSVVPRITYIEIVKPLCIVNNLSVIDDKFLLNMLQDGGTDWAANLVLYAKYKKDAQSFLIDETRKDWVLRKRSDDIDFWFDFLNKI